MQFDAIEAVEAKKKQPKQNRSLRKRYHKILDELVIKGMTPEGYIRTEYRGVSHVFDIVTAAKYDIELMDDESYDELTNVYWDFMKNYPYPIKEVYLNFNEDNQEQQAYFMDKIKKSTRSRQTELLQNELNKLQYIEKSYRRKDVYLFLFAENVHELEKQKEKSKAKFGRDLGFGEIDFNRKARVIATIINGGAPKEEISNEIEFLEYIQPQGNISFKDEFYVRTGHGYQACLHIYKYPTIFQGNWLLEVTDHDDLLGQNESTSSDLMDTIVTVDYMTENDQNYSEVLKGTVNEYASRVKSAPDDTTRDNNIAEHTAARELAFKVNNSGERIKVCHIRIFVSASTQEGMEKKVEQIRDKLANKGYHSEVFLDENLEEWQSLFLGYDQQKKLPSFHPGNTIPAEAMGVGFSYNQTFLKDPSAGYFGLTRTGGTVYWDLFHKAERRLSYNVFVVGDMGAGKSTALKKIVKDNAIKGNFIRGFDKAGEFIHIVKDLGGYSIKLNGEDGRMNIFQVYPNITKKDEQGHYTVDEEKSFSQHVKTLGMIYQLKSGSSVADNLDDLTTLAYEFYREMGLWGGGQQKITNLPDSSYPILEDWVRFLDRKTEQEKVADTKKAYREIYKAFNAMLQNYGSIFNGTTTIPDFSNQPIVFYETGGLESFDDYVFDIQIYNATIQIWSTMTTKGREEQNAFTARQKSWNDFVRFLVVMDECHNYLNIEKAYTAKFFVTMLSEARKFFSGLVFATQRLERMFPRADNVQSSDMVKAANSLREIVGLCSYKMIFKMDATSMDLVNNVFGNQLTRSEYEMIPYYGKGDCTLSISGDQNINMHVEITDEEEKLFAGGA